MIMPGNPAFQLLIKLHVGIVKQPTRSASASYRLHSHSGTLCPPCLSLDAHEQRCELVWWLSQMKCVMDKDYVPNFKTAFEHFLVHTGGRAVIEEVEKKLRLDPADVQPSKETLYRYGNTCCAAVFYVLTNMESRVSTLTAHLPCMLLPSTQWHLLAMSPSSWYTGTVRDSLYHCASYLRDGCQGRWNTFMLPQ